ncbi:Uncharacterized protein Rs2_42552 [Raphanus sativus]|nr:Uncharacterized protein Rs2_42552 [Raphanus sativus]
MDCIFGLQSPFVVCKLFKKEDVVSEASPECGVVERCLVSNCCGRDESRESVKVIYLPLRLQQLSLTISIGARIWSSSPWIKPCSLPCTLRCNPSSDPLSVVLVMDQTNRSETRMALTFRHRIKIRTRRAQAPPCAEQFVMQGSASRRLRLQVNHNSSKPEADSPQLQCIKKEVKDTTCGSFMRSKSRTELIFKNVAALGSSTEGYSKLELWRLCLPCRFAV